MWPSNKDIPLFMGVPVTMTHRVETKDVTVRATVGSGDAVCLSYT